jgi:hypothetical protein
MQGRGPRGKPRSRLLLLTEDRHHDEALPVTAAWARAYADVGWKVFPLWPGEKRPIYDGWPTGATTDHDLIDRYWADSTRNIGVVCGDAFDAWDIESEHLEAFSSWMNRNGYILPESPIAQTGRGGRHILTQPTGVGGSRNLYLDGTHIGELKSTGGFIVISPSVTDSQYLWLHTPEKMAVQPAPDWLLQLLDRPRGEVHKYSERITDVDKLIHVLEVLSDAVNGAGEGKRNNYLYWALRRALEEGIPPDYAIEEFQAVAREAGLDEHEIEATIRSAAEAEAS